MATRTHTELDDHLDVLRGAPASEGTLAMVVRRPAVGEREILEAGQLDVDAGLVGDNWLSRATSYAIEAGRHLDAQLNVMSARMARAWLSASSARPSPATSSSSTSTSRWPTSRPAPGSRSATRRSSR